MVSRADEPAAAGALAVDQPVQAAGWLLAGTQHRDGHVLLIGATAVQAALFLLDGFPALRVTIADPSVAALAFGGFPRLDPHLGAGRVTLLSGPPGAVLADRPERFDVGVADVHPGRLTDLAVLLQRCERVYLQAIGWERDLGTLEAALTRAGRPAAFVLRGGRAPRPAPGVWTVTDEMVDWDAAASFVPAGDEAGEAGRAARLDYRSLLAARLRGGAPHQASEIGEGPIVTRFAARRSYHQTLAHAGTLERRGWRTVALPGAFALIRRHGDRAVARLQRAARVDLAALDELSRNLGLAELLVEPAPELCLVRGPGRLERLSYRPASHDRFVAACAAAHLQPVGVSGVHGKTLVVDIAPDDEALMAGFSARCRGEIARACGGPLSFSSRSFDESTGLEIEEVAGLHRAWRVVRPHAGYDQEYLAAVRRCFADEGALVLARRGGELVGAAHVLFVDRVGVYLDSFTTPEVRPLSAGSGLVFTSMQLARRRGCDLFDLSGCHDERYPGVREDWIGFSDFKRKLNPQPVYYPPALRFAPPLEPS